MPVFSAKSIQGELSSTLLDSTRLSGQVSRAASGLIKSVADGVVRTVGQRTLAYGDQGGTYLRTPRQASRIYDVGGPHAVRARGLFYVRFRRAGTSESDWQRDIGFLVKSMDQPKVQPKTEEVNQYNKKRQVYTGYDVAPITMTVFDTADGTAAKLWNEYSKFFFGDFSQDEMAFKHDQLNEVMYGDDLGYGLVLREVDEAEEANSHFFFQSIDIYKVFANEYVKTTLVNPRITSFDPDDLDYEQMTALTYRIGFSYEAVLYENDGAPQAIETDSALMAILGDPRGEADVIDVSGPPRAVTTTSIPGLEGISPEGLFGSSGPLSVSRDVLGTDRARSGVGGVLGAFGNFNFGNLASEAANKLVSGRTQNMGSELLFAATGNASLSTLLNLAETKRPAGELASQALYELKRRSPGVNPALYDAAQASIALKSGNKLAAGKLAGEVVSGILGSAALNGNSARDQVTKSSAGMELGSTALNLINSKRSPSSQIGFKK